MLHVTCILLRPGHLSVRVGNGLRRSEKIVKNLNLRLWMQLLLLLLLLLLLIHLTPVGLRCFTLCCAFTSGSLFVFFKPVSQSRNTVHEIQFSFDNYGLPYLSLLSRLPSVPGRTNVRIYDIHYSCCAQILAPFSRLNVSRSSYLNAVLRITLIFFYMSMSTLSDQV